MKLRPLQYLDGMRPREKGVDVAIAVDAIEASTSGKYETIAVFSGDTDLQPALEYILRTAVSTTVVTVGWQHGPILVSPTKMRLARKDFDVISDATSYGVPRI